MNTQIEYLDEFELTLHSLTQELIMQGSMSDILSDSLTEPKASEYQSPVIGDFEEEGFHDIALSPSIRHFYSFNDTRNAMRKIKKQLAQKF